MFEGLQSRIEKRKSRRFLKHLFPAERRAAERLLTNPNSLVVSTLGTLDKYRELASRPNRPRGPVRVGDEVDRTVDHGVIYRKLGAIPTELLVVRVEEAYRELEGRQVGSGILELESLLHNS